MKAEWVGGPNDGQYVEIPDGMTSIVIAETPDPPDEPCRPPHPTELPTHNTRTLRILKHPDGHALIQWHDHGDWK